MSVYEIVAKNLDQTDMKKGTVFYTAAKIIFAVIVINMLIAAIYFAERYVRKSSYFAVNSVHISGNKLLSSASIVASSGVKRGQNIFDTDIDYIHRRISAIPWIKWAGIEKEYPNKISITIVERSPAAVIKAGDIGFIIDEEGVVLSSEIAWRGGVLPVISDINTPVLLKPGDTLTDERVTTVTHLIKALQEAGFDKEYQIDGRDKMRPVMLLKVAVTNHKTEDTLPYSKEEELFKGEVPIQADNRAEAETANPGFEEKRVIFYKDYIDNAAYNLTALLKGIKADIENLSTIDLSFKDKAVVFWEENQISKEDKKRGTQEVRNGKRF